MQNNIRVIRVIRVQKKSRVQSAVDKIRESEIRVQNNIRVIRVQKNLVFKVPKAKSVRAVCQKPRVRKPRVPKRFVLFVRFVFKKSRVKKISCSSPRVPKSRTHHVSNPKCHR